MSSIRVALESPTQAQPAGVEAIHKEEAPDSSTKGPNWKHRVPELSAISKLKSAPKVTPSHNQFTQLLNSKADENSHEEAQKYEIKHLNDQIESILEIKNAQSLFNLQNLQLKSKLLAESRAQAAAKLAREDDAAVGKFRGFHTYAKHASKTRAQMASPK